MAKTKLMLFVCTANMCRSPMAEYMFRKEAGPDSGWRVASSGIAAASGAPASEAAVEIMNELGLDLSAHRSQPLTRELVDEAELIVVMTAEHAARLLWRFPDAGSKIRLLASFVPNGETEEEDIPDPVGFGEFVYRGVRDLIAAAIPGLLEYVRRTRN